MTEVFLENQRLDTTEGLSNLLNYAIDDIKDIGSRNTSFSKTIIFPGTSNNNIQFGHNFDVRVSNQYNEGLDNVGYNFNPAKQADCIIFFNHVQVFKGILRLLKMVILDGVVEYECAVFGELGGLINSIGNSKLQDLDFSAYDHDLNVTNISDSWNVSGGTGYFYPLADYGLVSTNKEDFQYTAFRPALFVKEYLDKMFAASGYSYESALFQTERFRRLIVPHNQKALTKNENIWIDAMRDDTAPPYDGTVIEGIAGSGPASGYVYWDSFRPLVNFTAHAAAGQYDYFTYNNAASAIADVRVVLNGNYSNDGCVIEAQVRQNGSPVGYIYFGDTGGVDQNLSLGVSIYGMNLTLNDVLDIQVFSDGVGDYRVDVDQATFKVTSLIPAIVPIVYGDSIQMNDTIPRNVLQRDFLSSILKLFNLYVYEDTLKTKFVNIKPYVDFYDLNVSGITEWTYKMDRAKAIELVPMSQVNGRYYNFKFKQDTDYYNETYRNRYGEGFGDYLFDSEFAFSGESVDVGLIFAATPLVGYAGLDKFAPAYFKLSSNVEQTMDCVIRILQSKKITGVASWDILNVATVLGSYTDYGYAGNYDDPDAPANDIHFGVPRELFFDLLTGAINVHQFNVYWSSYMAEITDKDSKLLTAFFKLTNKDIFSLDFSKLVYVDGSYWRLNKIIDWNASEPDTCKVELLKVIQTVY